ncbi:MAG: glycerophosphodiester phosphodiesterase family protein [Hyphomonadaceae bacterium]|nr:glycerophosphodiester phosphodiesterase family protein [Hyphomonadaceae bacterium]
MKKRWIVAIAVAAVLGGVFGMNASFWGKPEGVAFVLAHRGVHQRFHTEGLTNETCTAARILPPTHAFLENTLPSIEAAFAAGADMVEIDVHPTTDGEFAVFHDWTLECRTDGHGVTRTHTMQALRALDVGYGYTHDGGATFPFRGRGVGAMPTLGEVLAAFPERRFLVNFKGSDAAEGDAMAAYLDAIEHARPERLAFFGGAPARRLDALRPEYKVVTRRGLRRCATDYVLFGWLGVTPEACRDSIVFAPINYARFAWGWPDLFVSRMQAAGSEVVLIGPIDAGGPLLASGIDDAATLDRVPAGWRGGVSTDAVEIIGPLLAERAQ